SVVSPKKLITDNFKKTIYSNEKTYNPYHCRYIAFSAVCGERTTRLELQPVRSISKFIQWFAEYDGSPGRGSCTESSAMDWNGWCPTGVLGEWPCRCQIFGNHDWSRCKTS